MRIGAAFEPTGAAFYRGVYPLEAMARRGHHIVWPENDTGHPKLSQLAHCDVIYVYRAHDDGLRRVLASHRERGIGIVWDNDDDLSSIPKHSPTYREVGGLRAQKRFSETVRMGRVADVVTVTTEVLRERYASTGLDRIEVIDNMLPRRLKRRRRKHDGVVVGWIAGMEHLADARALQIPEALRRLQETHPDVHVECVGVNLNLRSNYIHHPQIHFLQLPEVMAGFDIGLAPLTDIPFNRARSSIKVKEYAASQVPWLASPVAPYLGLGPDQGGLVVPDGEWFEVLDELVRDSRARKRLAKAGKRWAKSQTIDEVAERWERVFTEAAEGARDRMEGRAVAVR